jgi:hypothetical protein
MGSDSAVQAVSLFFLPVARWRRQQLDVCGICGTAVEI